MKNVRVLDCTLRDGGRIINCAFPDQEIRQLSHRLANAKIDIVEIGFLRDYHDVTYTGDSTFFTDVDQMIPFIDKDKKNTMYVAFIDYGMFDFSSLKAYYYRSGRKSGQHHPYTLHHTYLQYQSYMDAHHSPCSQVPESPDRLLLMVR